MSPKPCSSPQRHSGSPLLLLRFLLFLLLLLLVLLLLVLLLLVLLLLLLVLLVLLLLLLLWRVWIHLGHKPLRPLLDCFKTLSHLLELALEALFFLCELEDEGGPLGEGFSLLSPAGTVRASIWRDKRRSSAVCRRFASAV